MITKGIIKPFSKDYNPGMLAKKSQSPYSVSLSSKRTPSMTKNNVELAKEKNYKLLEEFFESDFKYFTVFCRSKGLNGRSIYNYFQKRGVNVKK